jgi:hypothetical protein
MNRKMYQPTKNQERKWAAYDDVVAGMPTDEEFKLRWKRSHHGKEAGWGMGKRNWVLAQMTQTREYQMGIWQGRVDRARCLGYSEARNENTYNLGYFRGYNDYESDRRGWDAATRERFDAEYVG